VLWLLGIILALWLLLQMPFFQTWMVHMASKRLSKSLHTTVKVGHVNIGWLNKLNIEKVLVEDQHKDTLLTAGLLQVNITDWFFLKDSADLKYIKLADVNAKLYRRTDSIWNYQFLVDFFGSGSQKKDSGGGIALHLKAVDLENIHFEQLDEWRGKSIIAGLGKLHMKANEIDFNKSIFDIEHLEIEKPEFREIRRRGNWRKTDSIGYWKMRDAQAAADTLPHEITAGKMTFIVNNLDIKDGLLQFYNRRRRPLKVAEFDERDIIITGLDGNIKKLEFIGDTLFAKVKLKATERSGLQIKKLVTDLSIHPKMIELANLDLQLNESRLTNYYAMHFNTIDDMDEFVDSVKITARLQNSVISMHDIGFFAPVLKTIHQTAVLTGSVNMGKVSDFTVNGLDLRTGQSRLVGKYSMKGLVDIEKTIIDFETPGSQVALEDVAFWAPSLLDLKSTPVGNLGVVTYTGIFHGTPFDFNTKANLKTSAGSLDTDFSLKLDGKGMGYNGIIRNAKLDGGKLLGVPKLGLIEFNGTVGSTGFSVNSPLNIKGHIARGEYANYIYHDIGIDGIYQNRKLTSKLSVADENLAGNFETVLDFAVKKQRYNARGIVDGANLLALGFIKDSLRFSGEFDVDFQGQNIDDFLGYARFYNTKIVHGHKRLSFDSLLLASAIDTAGIKTLSLHTNEADAYVKGKFNLRNLPSSFQYFLSQYYPALIAAPKNFARKQDIQFNVNTRQVEPFLVFFDKKLKGMDNAKLTGSLNTDSSELFVNADVPSFSYGSVYFSNAALKASGTGERLNVLGSIDNLQVNDSLNFPNAVLRLETNKDTSHVVINTRTQGPLGDAQLDAFLYSSRDGFEVKFNESSFIINSKKWTINSNGNIALKNGYLTSDGIVLQQDQQQIKLYTHPSGEGNWNDILVDVKNLNTGDLLPYFVSDPRMEGIASGSITVADPRGNPHITSSLKVDQFSFNDDSVGTIQLETDYSSRTKVMVTNIISANKDYDFTGKVALDLRDSAETQINTIIPLKNMRINILKKYLTSVFDDVDGYANGQIQVVGKLKAPSLLGKVNLTKGSLTVGYTKCTYTIDSALVTLGDNYMDFGKITLKDEKKRSGIMEGRFYHRFFDSLSFNMKMQTNGMTILNTSAIDNDLFYGRAVAKASLELQGPPSNLTMKITGTPTDSSHIFISNRTTRESGEADFIVFKTYGTEMAVQIDPNLTNIKMDLDLTANPLVKIDLILDPLTGDVIKATGNGNIKIHTGTYDATVMKGRYNITKGSYDYDFQALIRKPFILAEEDDNSIEWTGDPMDANLHISARYVASQVSMSTLVGNGSSGTNTPLDQNARNAKGDVYVIAKITGKLSKPDIDFDIEFPSGSTLNSNISAQDMLRRIRNDNTEKLRQVTYLIVFKSFAPYKEGGSVLNPGTELAVNTITDIVSREMGKILTSVVHNLTGDQSLNVDVSTNFYNSSQFVNGTASTSGTYDRVNLNFNVNRSYFNNRVVINLGSDFDLSVRNTNANGFQFLPDISVEFIFTSNRRLRGILFKRDNLDIGGRRNRAGASLSYRKDFEKLFGSNREESLLFLRGDGKPKK
jgi:hypothetical protein